MYAAFFVACIQNSTFSETHTHTESESESESELLKTKIDKRDQSTKNKTNHRDIYSCTRFTNYSVSKEKKKQIRDVMYHSLKNVKTQTNRQAKIKT